MIKKQNLVYLSVILTVIFPVIFSVFFSILGIKFPSYLLIILLLLITIFILQTKITKLYFSFSKIKIFTIIFFLYILMTSLYSPSIEAKSDKILFLFYSSIIPIFLVNYILTSNQIKFNLLKFTNILTNINFIILVMVFLLYLLDIRDIEFPLTRWTLKGSNNPIWFGRFLGLLILPIIISDNFKNYKKIISVCIFMILMMSNNSRAPFLSLIIVLLVYYSRNLSIFKKRLMLILAVIFSGLIISRMNDYIIESADYSLYERSIIVQKVLNYNLDNIFLGYGLGSFGILIHNDDSISYPHNIFLEILFENGLIGIILFLVLFYFVLKKNEINLLSLLICYFFFNSLVSGDLTSNNQLFLAIIIFDNISRNKKINLNK